MQTRELELRDLMISGLAGDGNAHRVLLSRMSRHLRAYFKGKLVRMGRSSVEAEDLVQEALIAIHTRRHTYDPAKPFTPWAYAIARYKLIDHLRKTRGSMAEASIEDAAELTARDDHAGTESALDLNRLLERIPEKMRSVIRLVKLDGLSIAETAARCGMSESAVKVNVHRGVKAIAASIDEGRE